MNQGVLRSLTKPESMFLLASVAEPPLLECLFDAPPTPALDPGFTPFLLPFGFATEDKISEN